MRTATKQEAINGNSNDTVITPLRLKQVLDTVDINPGEGGGGSDSPVYTAGAGISITNNVISNTITKTSQLTNDSNFITADDIPDIDINDPVPINSIWDYEGDTVPDGFIEVEEEQVVVEETDPTVPDHVKAITQADIDKWNSGTGGSGGSGGSLEIETITINPNMSTNEQGGTIYAVGIIQKCGNECKLILTSSAGYNIPNATYTVIGVIPEGYRPKESVAFVASARKTDYTTLYNFLVVVNKTGEISVMQRTGSNFHVGDIRGTVSYYIDKPLQLPGGGSVPLEIKTVNVPILTGLNTDNPSLVVADFITARKCGNICTLTIVGGSGISIKNRESKTIANLPEGYRPIQTFGGPVTLKADDRTWDAVGKSQLVINADGRINLQQYTGSDYNYIVQLVGNYTYFTNE